MSDKRVPLRLAFLWLALLAWPGLAAAKKHLGVPLPTGAAERDVGRFRSPMAYEATLRWMERNLASSGARVRFETVIDLPEVIAAHVEAPNRKTRWTGINVSQYGGAVWIFVIARSGSE